MFLIEDGRKEFFQWDVNRRLIIEDSGITQVHFCNRTDECSLGVEVYADGGKRYADVPNILLQTDWDIRVYAYDTEYTKHYTIFNVVKRSKPADYVYTETEVLNYDKLEAQINAIKEDIGVEIEAYMKENPVEVDLTGLATEQYVQEQIANIDIPEGEIVNEVYVGATQPNDTNVKLWVDTDDTLDFATTGYVDEAISKIDIPETDLSNYYTKQETNTAIAQAQPDLSGYALKTEIPSTTGLATEKYVDDAVDNIDIPDVDLSNYYTKEETDNAIASSGGGGSDMTVIYLTGTTKQDLSYFNGITANNAKDYIDNCVMYMEGHLCLYIEFEKNTTASKNKLKFGYLENIEGNYFFRAYYVEQTSSGFYNSMTIRQYAYSNNDVFMTANNVSNYVSGGSWQWYDATDYIYVPVNYVTSTSHIKVLCYYNNDTNNIIEFDISSTAMNYFYEEWGTKYYVPNPIPDNTTAIYFYNDGGTLYLKNESGDDLLENGTVKLLGFHYFA